jgi:transcriptional regulator with XRE-family HTH domain
MDLKEVIGKNITSRREELGLTQDELSKLSGVTKGQISEYERYMTMPKADTLYRLSIALNTDINYFYIGMIGFTYQTDIETTLLNIYSSLQIEQQEKILEYIQFVVKKIA